MTCYFYCKNKTKYNCTTKLRITKNYDGSVSNIATSGEHVPFCLANESVQRLDIKNKLIRIYNRGIKRPREILQEINYNEKTCINISLIYSIVRNIKRAEKFEISNFCSDDLLKLMQTYIQGEAVDPVIPYILDYEIKPLKILFTSNKLVTYLSLSTNIHIDSTYKLTLYGFPVIIVGVSDVNRRFYCSPICLVENENSETHDWIFNTLFKAMKDLSGFVSKKNFIGDNAVQITSSVKKYYENALRTNYWAHIYRLMSLALKLLPKDFRDEAINDIKSIQVLTFKNLFNTGLIYFKKNTQALSKQRLFTIILKNISV